MWRVLCAIFLLLVGTCLDGAHSAHSAEPFGLTVWGWDTAVSYAYPAGLSTKPINDVIIVP